MSRYRIYYLKESQRQHFRQAPPGPAALQLKRKDYEADGEIEAASPYAAWKQMLADGDNPRPIGVGDALETDTGALVVCKYVGFEEARWHVPEAAEATAGPPAEPPAPPPAVSPSADRSPSR